MIRYPKGFTLIELMVSMGIGLSLLTSLMVFWLELSKNSHREIIKLELSQDYLEVVSYLRSMLGRAVFNPLCLNPEWLQYQSIENEHPMASLLARNERIFRHISNEPNNLSDYKVMIETSLQYPSLALNDYKLKTLQGSDLIEIIHLTPLSIDDGVIKNSDDVKGITSGYIFATDCQRYILGRYHKSGLNHYSVSDKTMSYVKAKLRPEMHIQYYKINRTLVYVSYEHNQYYLVHNFLDGSNHMRFPNVKRLKIQPNDDWQLLSLEIMMPSFEAAQQIKREVHIRLLNL